MKTAKAFDLKTFKWPELTAADVAFPTLNTDSTLLKAAEDGGFHLMSNEYNKLVSTIFYSGGTLVYKPDVDGSFREQVMLYFRCLIGSWGPKHEHKTAICAYLLSHIAEPKLAEQ